MPARRWTDDQLRDAIATCTTWAAVHRHLGLRGRSDAVRERCEVLGLDHSHIGTPASRRRWTDEQLIDAVAEATSLHQVFVDLGLVVGGGSWMSLQDHIRRLNIDTTHWERPVPQEPTVTKRVRFDWPVDVFEAACDGARSVAQVMERLGLDPRRKLGRRAVERRMRERGVDPSALPGQGWSRANGDPPRYRKPLSEILVAGRVISSTEKLKERLVGEGILDWRCAVCCLETWRSKRLVLQLDHINGDRRDNRIGNLRFLCPNCHSQTDTFAGKNMGRGYSPGR
jgi:hypothetical protein